jgi:hypothetical protein
LLEADEANAGWRQSLQAHPLGSIPEKNQDRTPAGAESVERLQNDVPPFLGGESANPYEQRRGFPRSTKQFRAPGRGGHSGAKCRRVDSEGDMDDPRYANGAQASGLSETGYEDRIERREEGQYTSPEVRDDGIRPRLADEPG